MIAGEIVLTKVEENETTTALAFRHRYEGPFFRRLMLAGIRHMPRWLQRATMPVWGALFYALIGRARRAAMHNLKVLLGLQTASSLWNLHKQGLALFRSYAQMITDTYQTYMGLPLRLELEEIGKTPKLLSLIRENGAIMATGHIGMWQVGPFLSGWKDLPPLYVARAEEPNPMTQKWEERFQQKLRIIYTNASPFSALSLTKVLREKAVVGMQIDRVLGEHFHWVRICDNWARFPIGPALIARMCKVPLIPSFFMLRKDGGAERLVHHVGPAVFVSQSEDRDTAVRAATEQLASVYEQIVKQYPTQFFQFFDFFSSVKE